MRGDGDLDPGETCDDSNNVPGDGCSAACALENQPPTVNAGPDQTVNEGTAATLAITAGDPDAGDTFSVVVTCSDGSSLSSGGLSGSVSLNLSPLFADSGVYTCTATATDSHGASASDTVDVIVLNLPPSCGAIIAPLDPVKIGTTINVSASFSDPGSADTHTASFAWGDGTSSAATVVEAGGAGTASGSHAYAEAGVYTLTLTVTDDEGASCTAEYQYVVAYDSNGGFVTGGGWIDSPAGAYAADPTLAGKANFGFVSKYLKGATTPTGSTEFQFHAADFNFHSASYQWLVIAGARAQYKGTGTINGAGSYGFLLTAIDGAKLGGGAADRFRIKIWDGSGTVVYDNQPGASEVSDASTAIGGGSIVIHAK